jgi:hypothetical protein
VTTDNQSDVHVKDPRLGASKNSLELYTRLTRLGPGLWPLVAPGTSKFMMSNVILQDSIGATINSTNQKYSCWERWLHASHLPYLFGGSVMIVLFGLAVKKA